MVEGFDSALILQESLATVTEFCSVELYTWFDAVLATESPFLLLWSELRLKVRAECENSLV